MLFRSNLLASRIVGRWLGGFSSVGAAGLGYLIRVSGRSSSSIPLLFATVFQDKDVRIGYAHAYWSHVAWTVIGCRRSDEWFPRLMPWLLGGLAGSILAEFHLEYIDPMFPVRDLLGFFGW